MKYDPDHNYRAAFGIMCICLIPFYVLIFQTDQNSYRNPTVILFTIIYIATEYAFTLPRQAMKIYEEIIFKSYIESINTKIKVLLLIVFSVSEIYYFTTHNVVVFFISIIILGLWYGIFENQSIIIGTKNIIIGRKLIPYASVKKITYDKKNVVIVVNGKPFKIYNWAIGTQRYGLETFKKEIDEKVIE